MMKIISAHEFVSEEDLFSHVSHLVKLIPSKHYFTQRISHLFVFQIELARCCGISTCSVDSNSGIVSNTCPNDRTTDIE